MLHAKNVRKRKIKKIIWIIFPIKKWEDVSRFNLFTEIASGERQRAQNVLKKN